MKSKIYLFVLAFIASPVLTFAVCTPNFLMDINSNGDSVCTGVTVTFTNNSDLNGGEIPEATVWNFGDGSPLETTVDASHTYFSLVDTDFVVTYTISSLTCNGLVYRDTVHVVVGAPTLFSFGSNVNCFGTCNATATVNIISGYGGYSIVWDDPLAQTGLTATDLCDNAYTATVTDIYGCSTASEPVVVTTPPTLTADIVDDTIWICIGDTPFKINASASGGIGPYTYSWDPGMAGGLDDSTSDHPFLTPDFNSYTTFTLTVTDQRLCQISDAVEVVMISSTIEGIVYSDTSGTNHVSEGTVYLYKIEGPDQVWETLDSVPVNASTGSYTFSAAPAMHDVIVLYRPTGATADSLLPTFYGDTYEWNDDSTLTISTGCDSLIAGIDIHCIGEIDSLLHGNCTISGHVFEVWCPNFPCKTLETDPIPLIDVVVKKTPPGNAVTYDVTDGGGLYQIDSLAVGGTYSFRVTVPGLGMFENYYFPVTLSDSGFNNLDFYVVIDSGYGIPGVYVVNPDGIEPLKYKNEQMRVFPNPFTDNCQLVFANQPNADFSFVLYDITGKLITSATGQGNQHLVKTETLEPGVYIAEITTGDDVFRSRVVKK